MKISIVTVCYNSAKTIRRTIESVLKQNYKDLDYVIIDGGSTDGTVDIIKEYENRIAYWCSEKDRGIYDAMNKGILKSQGDIIAFMNSDDWYTEGIFQKVNIAFEKQNIDILYGDFIQVWREDRTRKFILENANLEELHYKFLFCHQALFMKRNLFNKIGMYDTNYIISADYHWILRAYIGGAKFFYLPETICYYSFGGLSSIQRKQCAEEGRKIKLSLLPDELYEKYIEKIEKIYIESGKDNTFNRLLNGMLAGNQKICKKVHAVLKEIDNNIIIWGAGRIGYQYLLFFSEAQIGVKYIVDNDKEKWGTYIEGVEIRKPDELRNTAGKIIVAVKSDTQGILEQLQKIGILRQDILLYYEINKYLEETIE